MPAAFKDYYEILGVKRTATADEIKSAFRKLARKYHPDIAADKKAGEAKFKEINEAYEVLGDPDNRKKYDQLGENWNAQGVPPPGAGFPPRQPGAHAEEFHFEGTGFSDFFEQFFGHGFNGFSGSGGTFRAAPRDTGPRHGHDIEGSILVTLEEAMNGSIRSLSLQTEDPATGEVHTESFKVRIPKGALEGQVIRVPGKGGAGLNGGEPGHLFLRIRLASHPDFRPLGADLYADLPLAPWEAVLGTTVRLHGIDGDLNVKIPPGTVNGQKLRLRGRGLPKPKSEERGDFYVVVDLQLPDQVSPAEKELWQQLGQASHFNPRG
ncbi:MAG: J domain-containing protein [Methylacidiphilales bacterium]|nr:J domain-containing protein [Candidatus Methylacidiphilales bacterium]